MPRCRRDRTRSDPTRLRVFLRQRSPHRTYLLPAFAAEAPSYPRGCFPSLQTADDIHKTSRFSASSHKCARRPSAPACARHMFLTTLGASSASSPFLFFCAHDSIHFSAFNRSAPAQRRCTGGCGRICELCLKCHLLLCLFKSFCAFCTTFLYFSHLNVLQ